MVQGAGAEGGQRLVELGADARDLAFGDAGVRAQGLDQVVDRAGGHAVDVDLDDDRVQGLVDAAAALQQAGEEAAAAELGDREVQVAGGGGQGLVAVAVAVVGTRVGVLVPLGADPRARLGLDQFLEHALGHTADEFESVRRA